MQTRQQVVVIHGGTTYENHEAYFEALKKKDVKLEYILAHRDWKSRLAEDLGDEYSVYLPQMPNKQNTQYEEWKILFEKVFALLDENPILIGHSMGGIFLAKYLSENKVSKKIKKTFLVAAPFDDTLSDEGLYSFAHSGNLSGLHEQGGQIFIYHSEDDFVVPFAHAARYKEILPDAVVRTFKDLNHFLGETIPGLVEDICR